MPLVGGADRNGKADGDPTDLRSNRPYRASPTGLAMPMAGTMFVNANENVNRRALSQLGHGRASQPQQTLLTTRD
eukprot:6213045-Pleurochrysis_carterae.AAC.2